MNDPQININVMPGAQMNGYVKEQHNYFGNVQKIESSEVAATPVVETEAATPNKPTHQNIQEQNEEIFHFVHPELDDKDAWHIHNVVKRLITQHGIQEICRYLRELERERKVLLPQMASVTYAELLRMGMPQGEGYSEKYFMKHYNL